MKCWEHFNRAEVIKLVAKMIEWNPITVRTKGRPKNRWKDAVINDLKKITLKKLELCCER
jgi:hypothetical protein